MGLEGHARAEWGTRHGVVTTGDFREKEAGRPCRIVSDSDGLPVDGHGARSLRAAQRDAGYATSIIPDSATLHPGCAGLGDKMKIVIQNHVAEKL